MIGPFNRNIFCDEPSSCTPKRVQIQVVAKAESTDVTI